jgi:O-antigen ligase
MGRLSRFILATLLVVSPLLLGSNRAVLWALNGILASFAMLFFVLAEWKTSNRSAGDWDLPTRLLILILLPAFWMLFQLVPNVPNFLAHPVWYAVPDAAPMITLSPDKTKLALVWWLAMSVSFVAVRAGTRRGGSRFFLNLMLVVVLVVALFGLANSYFGWQSVGIAQKTEYIGWLTGTFVNRNTAASFFNIGIVIAVVLAMEMNLEQSKKFFGASMLTRIFLIFSSRISVPIVAGAIIFIAALLTGSRAGLASIIISLACVLALMWGKKRKIAWQWPIFLIVGLVATSVAANALYDRSDSAGSSFARLTLAEEALAAIANRPILGHGAGSYQSVEPLFHADGASSNLIWNHAHNTYLEAAADLGVPITLIWLGLMAALLIQLRQIQRQSSKFMLATIALFSITVSEGLHALVDFSLQTQAIAIYVACLLGLSIGEAMTQQHSSESGTKK